MVFIPHSPQFRTRNSAQVNDVEKVVSATAHGFQIFTDKTLLARASPLIGMNCAFVVYSTLL